LFYGRETDPAWGAWPRVAEDSGCGEFVAGRAELKISWQSEEPAPDPAYQVQKGKKAGRGR
jgi:hypothetical protein